MTTPIWKAFGAPSKPSCSPAAPLPPAPKPTLPSSSTSKSSITASASTVPSALPRQSTSKNKTHKQPAFSSQRLPQNRYILKLLGIARFPDESALGEWLRHLGPAGGAALRELVRDFCAWALRRAEPAAVRHGGMLEAFFDDTQIEVEGRRFEGAKINYEGNLALSWQTLWVGPFLADAIMGSPAQQKEAAASEAHGQDVSAWLPAMLEANC